MRLTGYARKRQHKREMKRKHAKMYHSYDVNIDMENAHREYDEAIERSLNLKWIERRNNGYGYWKVYYLSGSRKMAKEGTNRRIRRKYKNEAWKYEYRDVPILRNSDYQKEFDYAWTIW